MSRQAIYKSSYSEKISNTVSFARVQSDFSALQIASNSFSHESSSSSSKGNKKASTASNAQSYVNRGRALNVPETFLFIDYKKYGSVHHEIATHFCEPNTSSLIFKLNFLENLPVPVDKVYWKVGRSIRKVDSWIGSKERANLRIHASDVSSNLESLQEEDEHVLIKIEAGHAIRESIAEPRFASTLQTRGEKNDSNYMELLHRLGDLYTCFQMNNKIKEKVHKRMMEHFDNNVSNPEEGQGKHPAFGAIVYILGQLNNVMKEQPIDHVTEKVLEHDVFESFMVTPLSNRRLRHIKGLFGRDDQKEESENETSAEHEEEERTDESAATAATTAVLNKSKNRNSKKFHVRPTNALDILKFAAGSVENEQFALLPECVLFYKDSGRIDRAWFRIKALL